MLWLEESGRAFFNSDGAISKVVGMTNDVTEMRESERTLRELSGRLISSQEEERQRIARELHDHIGQEMALLCVQVHRLSSSQSDLESIQGDAQRIYKKAKDISTEISKLSHRLHSTELDFLGLTNAAERLCRDFSTQFGIAIDFASAKMPPKFDIHKTRCFYRVLQEALQNIAKHSRASAVRVRLDITNQGLTMEIQDNGVGFDLHRARFKAGLGLVSIRERLHLVGGRLTLNSRHGAGTTLAATVPI
jgi:signal transduction histidine kinase